MDSKKEAEESQRPAARPLTLLMMPAEILQMVAMELHWPDVLQARMTCRSLNQTCQTPQLWRRLLLKELGSSIPKPFFLPKPVEKCSAREIERALRQWDAPWLPDATIRLFRRDIDAASFSGRRCFSDTIALAPGGQWVLMCCHDGSVWYCDLSGGWTSTSRVKPRLLIPGLAPQEGSREEIDLDVTLAVDWTSDEALGSSVDGHYLTQFNIALLTCDGNEDESAQRDPMQVNVWRIEVQAGPEGFELLLGEHLSSFAEVSQYGVGAASLHGPNLAYSTRANAVFIVDWQEVNGHAHNEKLLCRCIHTDSDTRKSIYLLPGNRILICSDSLIPPTLHNWESDYPSIEISATDLSGVSSSPVWTSKKAEGRFNIHVAHRQPLIIGDALRVILPAFSAVYGLTIRVADHTVAGIQEETLLEAPFDGIPRFAEAFSYSRAIGLVGSPREKKLCYAQYSWKGSGTPYRAGFQIVDHPFDTPRPDVVFQFDQFTNRILAVDRMATCFFTIIIPSDLSPAAGRLDSDEQGDVVAKIDPKSGRSVDPVPPIPELANNLPSDIPAATEENGHLESGSEEESTNVGYAEYDSDTSSTSSGTTSDESSGDEEGTGSDSDGTSGEEGTENDSQGEEADDDGVREDVTSKSDSVGISEDECNDESGRDSEKGSEDFADGEVSGHLPVEESTQDEEAVPPKTPAAPIDVVGTVIASRSDEEPAILLDDTTDVQNPSGSDT
ncbi:hypothetical protein NMY22_g7958 [Coprinellus aureogranulatus]|nr:hypothetical protein NMY22_g7958 [Coprinellus aureogranulatus]